MTRIDAHTPPTPKILDISLSLAKLSVTVHQFKKLQRLSFLFYLCFLSCWWLSQMVLEVSLGILALTSY